MESQIQRSCKRRRVSHPVATSISNDAQHDLNFDYQPLPKNSIRVLMLDRGSGDEALRGDLEICNLKDARFSAISYAWGSPDTTRSIVLGGKYVKIRIAVYQALRRFRNPIKPQRVWIDSICINQNDILERNSQVTIMGRIYQHAKQVLVWLGESRESDAMAIWACHQLATSWTAWNVCSSKLESMQWDGASKSGFARRAFSSLSDSFIRCPCCDEKCEWQGSKRKSGPETDLTLYSSAQQSVQDLISKPYFERLWPIQEICMARACTFHVGRHSIVFENLFHALEMLATLQSQLSTVLELYLLLDRSRAATKASDAVRSYTPLLDLIAVTRKLKTGESHDRIYALRSLAHRVTARRLVPDYRLSFRRLWINATACVLTERSATTNANLDRLPPSIVHPSAILAQAAIQRYVLTRDIQALVLDLDLSAVTLDVDGPRLWEARTKFYKIMKLPTWVLDLQDSVPRHWSKYERYKEQTRNFCAGGTDLFEAKHSYNMPEQLEVKAVFLFKVVEIFRFDDWSVESLYACCRFARLSTNFPDLEEGNSQQKHSAASEMAMLLLQGHDNPTEDGINAHLDELQTFTDHFLNGKLVTTPAKFRRRQNALQQATPETTTFQMPKTPENLQTARIIFGRTFPAWQGTARQGCVDRDRTLALFSNQRIGWVPSWSAVEDSLYLVQGAPCPFVLRDRLDGTSENLGDAYVHGCMRGEAWPGNNDEVCSVVIR